MCVEEGRKDIYLWRRVWYNYWLMMMMIVVVVVAHRRECLGRIAVLTRVSSPAASQQQECFGDLCFFGARKRIHEISISISVLGI